MYAGIVGVHSDVAWESSAYQSSTTLGFKVIIPTWLLI